MRLLCVAWWVPHHHQKLTGCTSLLQLRVAYPHEITGADGSATQRALWLLHHPLLHAQPAQRPAARRAIISQLAAQRHGGATPALLRSHSLSWCARTNRTRDRTGWPPAPPSRTGRAGTCVRRRAAVSRETRPMHHHARSLRARRAAAASRVRQIRPLPRRRSALCAGVRRRVSPPTWRRFPPPAAARTAPAPCTCTAAPHGGVKSHAAAAAAAAAAGRQAGT